MPRGRPKLIEPTVGLRIYLPEHIWTQVKLECWDPVRQRAEYGRASSLIADLLRKYFNNKGGSYYDVSTSLENSDTRSLDSVVSGGVDKGA